MVLSRKMQFGTNKDDDIIQLIEFRFIRFIQKPADSDILGNIIVIFEKWELFKFY